MRSCGPIFPWKASAAHAIDWLLSRGSIKGHISPTFKGDIGKTHLLSLQWEQGLHLLPNWN